MLLLGPGANAILVGRDVRHRALALGIRPAAEALRRDDAAERIARRMAFRAMAGPLNEIGPAVPFRTLAGHRLLQLPIEMEQFPTAKAAANAEGEADFMRRSAASTGASDLM